MAENSRRVFNSIISGIACAEDMFRFLLTCALEYGDCSGEEAGHLWGSFCRDRGSVRSVSSSVSEGESSCAPGNRAACVPAPSWTHSMLNMDPPLC